ncbi:MAG: GTP-binding protein [Candidatus Lokiarchaeota archaeon]|nr:GTP-binding protein [Candidatus Lokiarchaeota archaeon]
MEKKKRVINVLVAGHSQSGKSSLISAICGVFPDSLDYELTHGTTISLKVIQFELKNQNILLNFLDSPGHADFKGGIALGLEFADILVLVVSGSKGFQARTYWLFEIASKKKIPIIIAATKMDLRNANLTRIKNAIKKLADHVIPTIETSAKRNFGIEELIQKISLYVTRRDNTESDLSFIILGFNHKKGIGELLNAGILSGKIGTNWITEKIKIRHLFSLGGVQLVSASQGEIIQISLNIVSKFDLGTKYFHGKFISPKIGGLLSEIHPRKEFYLTIENPNEFKFALEILKSIKKVIPSFDFYFEKNMITILVLGDLQFDFLKERLEDLMEFKVVGSKVKGIITIKSFSRTKHNSAKVRIIPRCKRRLTITRIGEQNPRLYDILAATAACEAYHLDGLHVEIFSGKNEDDIAQAIAKGIERAKVIKLFPHQDVIVKIENYHDLYSLIEKYNIEILHQTQKNLFFLQIKNQDFELFFNSLMKISKGRAEIKLFKFEQNEIILSVDPGTRHFGFCLIEKGELPSLWYVNLKRNIEDIRTINSAKKQITHEMDIFIGDRKEIISKIFIGIGPGSKFIVDTFIEYFNIPCKDNECIIADMNSEQAKFEKKIKNEKRFKPPEVYLVDEFKTTKEALFHLQQGKLVNEVLSKGFVDHAIAALLIAKRGIRGEILKIEKKSLKPLFEYILENYSGSYSFRSIHNITDLKDLKSGMYLRIKDSSKLDSNLSNGDIISFSGFGDSYNSIHAVNLIGNRIIIKLQGNTKGKRDFFKIFVPVKERN